MSAARGRRVHFATAEDVPASEAAVPSIGPVVFTVQLSGRNHVVDLSDLPCPRLVRGLAKALSRTAGDEGTQRTPRTVNLIVGRVRRFVEFVAATNADAAGSISLADVTPQLLDAYEHKLIEKYGQNSKLPYATMVDLIRLLKETQALNPGIFSSNMRARLGFSTTAAKSVMNPLEGAALANIGTSGSSRCMLGGSGRLGLLVLFGRDGVLSVLVAGVAVIVLLTAV